VLKAVHGVLQTLTGAFIALALAFAAAYKASNSGAHFWSVHAWVGAGAITLYALQYPLGSPMPRRLRP